MEDLFAALTAVQQYVSTTEKEISLIEARTKALDAATATLEAETIAKSKEQKEALDSLALKKVRVLTLEASISSMKATLVHLNETNTKTLASNVSTYTQAKIPVAPVTPYGAPLEALLAKERWRQSAEGKKEEEEQLGVQAEMEALDASLARGRAREAQLDKETAEVGAALLEATAAAKAALVAHGEAKAALEAAQAARAAKSREIALLKLKNRMVEER